MMTTTKSTTTAAATAATATKNRLNYFNLVGNVFRTQVTDLYNHFDVEADPPSYKRPPPSCVILSSVSPQDLQGSLVNNRGLDKLWSS
eukprot:4193675-Amphidinium_carterae.1